MKDDILYTNIEFIEDEYQQTGKAAQRNKSSLKKKKIDESKTIVDIVLEE